MRRSSDESVGEAVEGEAVEGEAVEREAMAGEAGIVTDEATDTDSEATMDEVAQESATDDAEGDSDESAEGEPEEDFDGFDGSWDYQWIESAEAFMEAMPWTWIAVAVFLAALFYSYRKNNKS